MVKCPAVPAEGFATTSTSESAAPSPPGTIETTANNAFGFGLISGTLLVEEYYEQMPDDKSDDPPDPNSEGDRK